MNNDYVVKKVYQSFLLVSILTALAVTAGMLIDNIVVGHFLGTNALAAMGIVGPISSIFSMVGTISSTGGTARAAQAVGGGDTDRLNRIFSAGITYTLIVGGTLTVIGVMFAPQIAVALGARDELVEPAVDYLRGYFLGAVPTIMLPTLTGFVKIDGSAKMPLISMGVMSAMDIILDLMMALVFHQGMFGMALATTISYFLAVAIALTHFMKKNRALHFTLPKRIITELKAITASGAPTAINQACVTFETAIFNNLLIAFVGAGAVAALNVRKQAYYIIGAVTMGVCQALLPVAGMFFGEEDPIALKSAVRTTFKIGMLLSGIAAVALLIIAPLFARLLGVADPDTLGMATAAVRVFAVSMPVQLFNMVWMNFYQSTKKSGMATMICILESFVYAVLAALALVRPFGSNGVWFAFLIGEVLTAITLYIFVLCRSKKVLPGLSDFMMLGKDFGAQGKQRWDVSIGNDIDEVLTLSEKITNSTQVTDIDFHTLNVLGLSIEEMAGNIVRHAFSPGKKKWFDIMILNKDNSIIVRMRDNGREFDPVRYIHENPDENDEKLGIYLISHLANKIEYRRALGLNNTIIGIDKNKFDK